MKRKHVKTFTNGNFHTMGDAVDNFVKSLHPEDVISVQFLSNGSSDHYAVIVYLK